MSTTPIQKLNRGLLSVLMSKLRNLGTICGINDANKFETRLDRALLELAEAKKDSERLDWMIVTPSEEYGKYLLMQITTQPAPYDWNKLGRAAIDAAMEAGI